MSSARELGGVDVFHLVRHREMKRRGLPGNACLFVIELDGRVDPRALERRAARAVELVPELGQKVRNGFPPRWVDGASPPVVASYPSSRTLEDALAVPVDASAPWSLEHIRGERGDIVLLRWFHALADGKAAERLARFLGSGEGDSLDAPPPREARYDSGARPIAKLDRDAKLAAMRAYNRHVVAVAGAPIMSAASTLPKDHVLGRTRVARITLDEDETRRFDARVREVAKLAETSLMLIASLRALDALLLARGFAPTHYLVPVPLSLDPKANATRLLGNNLTMMMFSMPRALLGDVRAGVAHIAEQQRAIVKQKLDVGMLAALDLARWIPDPIYRVVERKPTHGEFASLIFSNPGAVSMTRFAGVPVRDAYPLPTVVVPPGAQVIFTRFGGKLSALFVWIEGVLRDDEAASFQRALRSELVSS